MNYNVKYPFSLVSASVWLGFVLAISFMESWLKFKAPGITVPLGLGIGRLVFFALNKVEILLLLVIFLNFITIKDKTNSLSIITVVILALILIIQTFWLLPVLDERAGLHLKGEVVNSSIHHILFVFMEIIKVVSLSLLISTFFTKNQKEYFR